MNNLLQDLEVGEAILTDVAGYAAGQPISASPTLPTLGKVNVSAVALPNGPVAPYVTFSSNFLGDLEEGVMATAEWSAGQPVAIAVKVGSGWHGFTFTKAA